MEAQESPQEPSAEQKPVVQSRTTRKRTPRQLERQEKAFAMHLDGMTYREIAAELKCDKETVQHDIHHELERRAEELAEHREVEKAHQLALVDDLYKKSMANRSNAGTGALGAAGKALEMRAKLLGLDAPTKIDLGLSTLVDALDG